MPADCSITTDCAAGELCARYEYDNGCGPVAGYACTTLDDECREDTDCGQGYCKPHDGRRVCEFDQCVIGRPFLVEGQARLASAARRDDWLSDALVEPMQPTSNRARAEITEHWVRIGLMEHASIAAFARFSLQLLAFGAPASLLEATQRAMADETHHARLAFDLASRFARVPCGPGYLDVSSAMGNNDWADVVKATFVEGCIGETVAAMEAAEALQHARDPQVRATLEVIARDERRHAELAWQFIDWALSQTPQLATELRALIHAERAEATRRAGESAPALRRLTTDASSDERAKLAHGVVPEELSAQLRLSVLQTVVGPCAEALLKRVSVRAVDEAKSA